MEGRGKESRGKRKEEGRSGEREERRKGTRPPLYNNFCGHWWLLFETVWWFHEYSTVFIRQATSSVLQSPLSTQLIYIPCQCLYRSPHGMPWPSPTQWQVPASSPALWALYSLSPAPDTHAHTRHTLNDKSPHRHQRSEHSTLSPAPDRHHDGNWHTNCGAKWPKCYE